MTENEILDLLSAELELPNIEPDEVTIKMLEQHSNRSDRTASLLLKQKVDAGIMTCRRVRGPNGRPVIAYRMKAIQETD